MTPEQSSQSHLLRWLLRKIARESRDPLTRVSLYSFIKDWYQAERLLDEQRLQSLLERSAELPKRRRFNDDLSHYQD